MVTAPSTYQQSALDMAAPGRWGISTNRPASCSTSSPTPPPGIGAPLAVLTDAAIFLFSAVAGGEQDVSGGIGAIAANPNRVPVPVLTNPVGDRPAQMADRSSYSDRD